MLGFFLLCSLLFSFVPTIYGDNQRALAELRNRLKDASKDEKILIKKCFYSRFGQEYCILATTYVVWVNIRLFLEDEYLNFEQIGSIEQSNFAFSWHLLNYEKQIQRYRDYFDQPNLDGFWYILSKTAICSSPFFYRKVPSNWTTSPDKILKRGDILGYRGLDKRLDYIVIYLGNLKMAYFTTTEMKETFIGILSADKFYGDKLFVIIFPLRLKSREDIAVCAEDMEKFRRTNRLGYFMRDWRFLVTYCAMGNIGSWGKNAIIF